MWVIFKLFTVHGIFRTDPHATFMTPIDDENVFLLTYTSPTRGEEKIEVGKNESSGSWFMVFSE